VVESTIAMKKFFVFLGVIFCLGAQGAERKLFDGKSLRGWVGDTNVFHVRNGAIVGGSMSEKIPRNEFLCTRREYTNFVLKVKFKLIGGPQANGGVQFRTKRHENDNEVSGYQADMGEGYWGSLYDESRRRKTLASTHAAILKRIVRTNDWNEYVIRCEGPHVRLWLNGILTVDYTENEKEIPTSGLIGLQIHGGGKAEASYKDITIEKL
jgi:hypothetical protein